MNSQSNGLFWEEIFAGKLASLKSRFFDLSRKIDWRLFEEPLKAGLSRAKRFGSVRRYGVSEASLHESQAFEDVFDASNTNAF